MAYVIAACTVCVTILALVVNSGHFQIYRLTHSYSSYVLLFMKVQDPTCMGSSTQPGGSYSSTLWTILRDTTHNAYS